MAEEATSPPDQNDPNSGSSTTNNVSQGSGLPTITTQTSTSGTSTTTIAPRTSNGNNKKLLNGLTSVRSKSNGINGNGTPAVTKRKSNGGPTKSNGINGTWATTTKRSSNGGLTTSNGHVTSTAATRKSNGSAINGNGFPTATTRKSNGSAINGNGFPTVTTRKSNGSAINGNGFPTATTKSNGNGTTRKSNGGAINGNGTSTVATTRRSNGGQATMTTAKSNGKINGNGSSTAPTRTSNGQIAPGYGFTTKKSNGNGTTKNGLKPSNGTTARTNGNGINGNGTGTTTTLPTGSSTTAATQDYAPSETTMTPETAYTSPPAVEPVETSTTTEIPEGDEDAEVDHPESDTLGDDQEPDFEIDEEDEDEDEHHSTTQMPSAATSTEPPMGEEEEEEEHHTSGKRRGPLEYDLQYMYPEIDLLTKTRRRDWNFNDPEIIRAIWLEAKTHALADWKLKYSKIKRKKDVKVHDNVANQLRNEFRRMKQEKEEAEVASLVVGRDAPMYTELTLPTTVTAQMRYKINRNDPPIPDSFIFHFAKFKKPPFLRNAWPHDKCKEPYIGN